MKEQKEISSDAVVTLLRKAVSIDSRTKKEHEITDFFENTLKMNGFSVERQVVDETGRANIFAQKGENPSILFYGHMDTVDTTDKQKFHWDTEPFELTEKDGGLYALGAYDMKGGVVAFIEATRSSDTPVKILLGVDEEADSEGGWKAVREKPEFFDGIDLVISAEPSFQQGISGITTARTGRCVLNITFTGKAAHIMDYAVENDPVKKLCEFGNRLYAEQKTIFLSSESLMHIRQVHAETEGMSECGGADAIVEVFLGPGDTAEDVREKVQQLSDDAVHLKERKTPYLTGYHFYDFPYQEVVKDIIERNTGKPMTLVNRRSVADDNVIATLNIPVITWGPEGDNAHKANEYVSQESVTLLATMYKELLDSVGKSIEEGSI